MIVDLMKSNLSYVCSHKEDTEVVGCLNHVLHEILHELLLGQVDVCNQSDIFLASVISLSHDFVTFNNKFTKCHDHDFLMEIHFLQNV